MTHVDFFQGKYMAEKIAGVYGFLLDQMDYPDNVGINLIYHFITYNIEQSLILFLAED